MFEMPTFRHPDFKTEEFRNAPDAKYVLVEKDGVVPDNFHSTSIFPEYCKVEGKWILAEESRMDSSIVLNDDNTLSVVENRNVKIGDKVIVGRTERAEDGIFVWTDGFKSIEKKEEKFVFRQGRSRETSYARDYDNLIELLEYEKAHDGHVLWVMGPAFSFDADARDAMSSIINNGYCQGLMAGNALATHDLEGAYFHTALGQDIYTQESMPLGHYNHLDICNKVRRSGSIAQFIEDEKIDNGIIYSCVKNNIPITLASSIRDDGPLPEVISDAYEAQSAMREQVKKATTVISLATMLHTIATGNMTPSFRMMKDKTIRPLYFYTVDSDEFVVNKLLDRGSLAATTIVTNVQDFITIIARGLKSDKWEMRK
jgi:lysine-ketoglutarate reductase/saccharopine dehydrogenase-like protein (TIGR00300 family)